MNVTVTAGRMYSQIKKNKPEQKERTPAHQSDGTCVLPQCSGDQKPSATKHWETEFVNMSKSVEATMSFVDIR